MIMKNIWQRIKEFFTYIFGIDRIEYFDLIEEYEDYVRGENLSNTDVMVGTVRSIEQYDTNIESHFYHIPARYVDFPEKVEYIALYRSKNIFGKDEPGVKHYGKVLSFEKIKRREIKELKLSFNPDDDYYRFEVPEWKTLEFPIKARENAPEVYLLTNKFLLFNSKFFYELFIDNNELYKLNLGLRDIVRGVYDGFFVGNFKVRVWWKKIVIKSKDLKMTFDLSDFKRYPYATMKKIARIVLKDDTI